MPTSIERTHEETSTKKKQKTKLVNMVVYLLSDLGGNSNSPTDMVSTAFRAIRTTC